MYQASLYLKPNQCICLLTTSKAIKIGQLSQEINGVSKLTSSVNHPVQSVLSIFPMLILKFPKNLAILTIYTSVCLITKWSFIISNFLITISMVSLQSRFCTFLHIGQRFWYIGMELYSSGGLHPSIGSSLPRSNVPLLISLSWLLVNLGCFLILWNPSCC